MSKTNILQSQLGLAPAPATPTILNVQYLFFSFLCAHLLGKLMDNYKNNSVLSIVKIISWAGSDVEMSLVVFNFYPQQMQQVLEPPPPPVLLPGAVEANRRQHNILNFSIKILSFLILF